MLIIKMYFFCECYGIHMTIFEVEQTRAPHDKGARCLLRTACFKGKTASHKFKHYQSNNLNYNQIITDAEILFKY